VSGRSPIAIVADEQLPGIGERRIATAEAELTFQQTRPPLATRQNNSTQEGTVNGIGWRALLVAALLCVGCGGEAQDDEAPGAPTTGALVVAGSFTGKLTISSTTTSVGSPVIVTESATNLTGSQVGPLIVGINRAGLAVSAATKPATGICRIAGSATCNFVELAPHQTQSYTLTLVPNLTGTFQIRGWTTSQYTAGGSVDTVTLTVR
jgi:hypothetical protein